jgi:hypothetical protein
MKRHAWAISICLVLIGVTHSSAEPVSTAALGLAEASLTYGYFPYKKFYGPLYAQRELNYLTHQPGIRGLDYGYGCGYCFGFGPPKQYRVLPPTHQTRQRHSKR